MGWTPKEEKVAKANPNTNTNTNPNPNPNPNPYQARAVRCGHRAVRVQGGLGGRQLCAAGVRQAPSRLPQRGHLPRRDVLLPLRLHGRRLRPAALPPRVLRPRRVRPRRRVHMPLLSLTLTLTLTLSPHPPPNPNP